MSAPLSLHVRSDKVCPNKKKKPCIPFFSAINLAYLSPESKKVRFAKLKESDKYLGKKVKRYQKKYKTMLSERQSKDLGRLVTRVIKTEWQRRA